VKRALTAFGLAAATVFLFAGPASATEVVDDDHAQCPTAPHSTIQDGVDAASVNETVLVCNGNYVERVEIAGPAKDGVRLRAQSIHGATIKNPTSTDGGAIVHVDGADRVEVARFIILGPFGTAVTCPTDEQFGVLVDGDVTGGTVNTNLIRNINGQQAGACPFTGTGILFADSSSAVRADNNTVEGYEDYGIRISGTGTNATAYNNTLVAGVDVLDQAGVQVEDDAKGTGVNNRSSGNVGSPTDAEDGAGVRLLNADQSNVRMAGNRSFDNDVGLVLDNQLNALVENNFAFSNNGQGLLLLSNTEDNTIKRNDARSNDGLDCEDRSSGNPNAGFPNYTTQNKWDMNKGLEADPPPICTPSGARGTAFNSGGGTFTPVSRNEVEPNNSIAAPDAVPVTGDTKITAAIDPVGDLDFFRVQIPFGTRMRFETVVPDCSFDDTVMSLYNSSGAVVAQNDDIDFFGGNFCSRIVRILPAGTYYVRVEDFNDDNVIPTYNLEIDYAAP
jgi:parallel beta-helix repeat protein